MTHFTLLTLLREDNRQLTRVEHFVIFQKLVFMITSKISRVLKEHIKATDSSNSKLQTESIRSVGVLSIQEVIA